MQVHDIYYKCIGIINRIPLSFLLGFHQSIWFGWSLRICVLYKIRCTFFVILVLIVVLIYHSSSLFLFVLLIEIKYSVVCCRFVYSLFHLVLLSTCIGIDQQYLVGVSYQRQFLVVSQFCSMFTGGKRVGMREATPSQRYLSHPAYPKKCWKSPQKCGLWQWAKPMTWPRPTPGPTVARWELGRNKIWPVMYGDEHCVELMIGFHP